jgi:hypothetical protein
MRNVLLAVVGLTVFAGLATSAPVPKALKKPLRATIQPLPGEQLYSIRYYDEPLEKVMEEVERLTGLMFLSKDTPKVTITLKVDEVCVWELFAQLDDILVREDWLLIRKTQSFCCFPATERLDRLRPDEDVIRPDQLRRQSQYLSRRMFVTFDDSDEVNEALRVANDVVGGSLVAKAFGTTRVALEGQVMDLRAFVAEMGDHIKK